MMSKNIQGFLVVVLFYNPQGSQIVLAHSHCDVHLKWFELTTMLPVRIFKIKEQRGVAVVCALYRLYMNKNGQNI